MFLLRVLTRWMKREDGSTAIEFAMLSMPFIYILIGIMEISLMFASNSVLDGATQDAARMIRTGEIQQSNGDQLGMFKDKLCDRAKVLLNCTRLQLEVVEMDKFSDFASYAPVYDKDGNLSSRGFTPGGVNTINLIRVSYKYKFATPLIGNLLATDGAMGRTMISTVVLETEPYDIKQVNGT